MYEDGDGVPLGLLSSGGAGTRKLLSMFPDIYGGAGQAPEQSRPLFILTGGIFHRIM